MNNKPYPCLWFDGQAKDAAEFYVRIFPNSKLLTTTPMVAIYELNGQRYMNLNGGPEYKFSEALSFVIPCENQEEIDYYWTQLTEEGEEGKCGWLKDKFGVSWQVVPTILSVLMNDPEKAPKAAYAFLQMKKIDIQKLLDATE